MRLNLDIDQELFPFESKWLEIEGIPIHYVDEGRGPVLLLLHGNFMWSFSYRRLLKALRVEFRCISLDLPGFGLSAKPHRQNSRRFGYTYAEQRDVLKQFVTKLDLRDITFLSFDHGGPIGIGAMVDMPERYQRFIIANSWGWSCHDYRASNIWSKIAPRSVHVLRWLVLNKKRWLFETPRDLEDPRVWHACTAPYPDAVDFKPMATLAAELTRARSYFDEVALGLPKLNDLMIDIVWATKRGSLFPEFVEESAFLARWQSLYPQASVTRLPDEYYYPLVTRPNNSLLNIIRASHSADSSRA